MKTCPNCGEALTDEAVFCPECGTPVADSQAPVQEAVNNPAPAQEYGWEAPAAPAAEAPKKKKSKAGLVIGIVLAALVCAAALLYFTGAWLKILPASRLKLGMAEKALVDRGLDQAFENTPEQPEINADLKVSVDLDVDTSDSLFGLDEISIIKSILDELDLDVVIEAAEGKTNASIGVNYSGNRALDGTVLFDGETVGLYLPQLDENYYTISREGLMQLLNDGDETQVSEISLDLSKLDEERTRKEVMEILAIVAKLSTKDNTTIEKGKSVSLFGGEKELSCDCYTIAPTAEQIEAVINELADHFEDENSYLGGRIASVYSAIKEFSAATEASFSDYEDVETPDLPETFPELLRQKAKEAAKECADANMKIEVDMQGNTIVSQRVLTDDDSFYFDSEETDSLERAFITVVSEGETEGTFDMQLNTSDKSRKTGSLKAVSEGEELLVSFDFDTTKRSALGTYAGAASVKFEGNTIAEITITPDGADMKHVVKINLGEDDTGVEGLNGVTLNISAAEGAGVKAPTVEPTSLDGKSAEEISEIFEGMISELSSVLMGMLF